MRGKQENCDPDVSFLSVEEEISEAFTGNPLAQGIWRGIYKSSKELGQ